MDSINRIFQAIDYMNQHINDELSLDDFCTVTGYTKSHLSYIFKFYIGETPNKYFYKQKLRYGANLLFGCENVLDVALKVGFGSHEAFSRAFKKEFGMTPTEYRELHNKGLSLLSDLNEIELTMAFSDSPAYRVFRGLDEFGKHYDVYQSLIKKGFIDMLTLDKTLEGMQLCDKFYWDCSMLMIELSKVCSSLEELYKNTIKRINIPKLLFFKFAYGLVDAGKIRNIFLGCCGCNCFKCNTLKATLDDDDELRKKIAEKTKSEFNIIVDYTDVHCFGCTSGNRSESCIAHCPWSPCCQKNSVTRCNKCSQYPCFELTNLFNYLPDFKENFTTFSDLL